MPESSFKRLFTPRYIGGDSYGITGESWKVEEYESVDRKMFFGKFSRFP